ncbi:Kef-type K+ transport system, membrane component KefB [Anaerosporobacter mobilis DSM 15930]|jgi:Kef-type K+ transport system membrane component KefB|uniref:Kef-type K+ transport system, membrane component KefB n=1 Tax=Anaerosporobacter mobilis DSM 15930 TaxID=1120996 RepID=A0A1M7MIP9_9FIRM|nr:cation:proton antiporter [Anaerosporobacter mobilis]SHM90817.1 Kef-type K+ transport system, membrane component KefB [Anaerosporobacter mobilis DSM 15930]
MENKIIYETAIILISGILCGRIVKQIKLPNVTGYLIAGLILGPSILNWIPISMVNGFGVISDIALAFIAFSIGCEFSLSYFKKVGIAPIIIAIFEAGIAIVLVTGTCMFFGFDIKLSIMLGAIAAATAPAQTIMVINQYNAKGPLTSMLLSVVAIDDAVALIAFGCATTIVKMISSSKVSLVASLFNPFYEIVISVIIGGLFSLGLVYIIKFFKKRTNRLSLVIAFVLGAYWVATKLNGSPLLTCMAIGAVLTNISDEADELNKISEAFTPPIFMIFFVISGAGFDANALKGIGLIGVIYVIMRVLGKMLGAWLGGKVSKQNKEVCRYLGPTLMPQAGVALGLVVVAESLVPEYASSIRAVILCSTFIYSIIGPVVAKIALRKAGEIKI